MSNEIETFSYLDHQILLSPVFDGEWNRRGSLFALSVGELLSSLACRRQSEIVALIAPLYSVK